LVADKCCHCSIKGFNASLLNTALSLKLRRSGTDWIVIDGSQRTGKNAERSGYGLTRVACYPRICLEELTKPTKATVRKVSILVNI
jgi:hypothetical protein